MKVLHSSGSTSHAAAHRPGQPREPTDYSRAGWVGAATVGLRLAELLGAGTASNSRSLIRDPSEIARLSLPFVSPEVLDPAILSLLDLKKVAKTWTQQNGSFHLLKKIVSIVCTYRIHTFGSCLRSSP